MKINQLNWVLRYRTIGFFTPNLYNLHKISNIENRMHFWNKNTSNQINNKNKQIGTVSALKSYFVSLLILLRKSWNSFSIWQISEKHIFFVSLNKIIELLSMLFVIPIERRKMIRKMLLFIAVIRNEGIEDNSTHCLLVQFLLIVFCFASCVSLCVQTLEKENKNIRCRCFVSHHWYFCRNLVAYFEFVLVLCLLHI